jgi:pimeloyl-ACP methyl ester carboxylesterase
LLKTLTENNTAAGTAYVDCGNGEPLVLIHGVGLNRHVWQPQLEAFCDEYRVITYDTLGHGNSRIPAADVVLDDYFEQLAELLDTLEIDSVNLCGHSMGALITLGFSLKYPHRVRRIIPMMAAYDRTLEHQQRSRKVTDILAGPKAGVLLKLTLERWFTEQDYADPRRAEQISRVGSWLEGVDNSGYSRAYRVFAENGETYVGQLAGITAPALFVTAQNDANSTPEMSCRMADEVRQGQAHIMPGERHMGQYLAAASIESIIRRFLESPLSEGSSISASE